jgi:hypothetical protein
MERKGTPNVTTILPPLVIPEEIRTRIERPEPFSGPELDRVTAVCHDASALVRFESRRDWIDPDDPTQIKAPGIVLVIARRCAERAVRSPEGFSSESAGDYSYRRSGVAEEGGLFLTDREVNDLVRAGGGFGGIWTQAITRVHHEEFLTLGQPILVTDP